MPDALPERLPIFPLTGVLLLPHGRLPLNIFEPRYLAMVEEALATDRMIGMVQPKDGDAVYQTGCAGKITEFSETDDGRYLITLTGISRFHIGEELEGDTPFRVVHPDWSAFQTDTETRKCLGVDREKLQALLTQYFDREGMSCDYDKFEDIDDGKLMTCLAMVCPFEANEKQALLEEICCVERANMFMTMLEMAIRSGKPLDKSDAQCH